MALQQIKKHQKKILITYATKQYRNLQKQLIGNALEYGISIIFAYSEKDLYETVFYEENRHILDQPRGAGYWLWKPYFILESLNVLNDGDEVIYCDAGVELIAPLDILFETVLQKNDVGLFSSKGYLNRVWTKRDAFVFLDADFSTFWDLEQVAGTIILLRNSSFSRRFIANWLDVSKNGHILMDDSSILGRPELPEFVAHRHDQSILTILARKYEIAPHRHPSQFGNGLEKDFPEDLYPQICFIHRSRPLDRHSGCFQVFKELHKNFCCLIKVGRYFLKALFLLPIGLWNSVLFRCFSIKRKRGLL